ncbi:MAG: replication-associated recombination protein A [Chloroflexota bacterium]
MFDSGDQPGLFETVDRSQPLAARMRPRELTDVIGQDAVLGPDKPLLRAIQAGRTGSLVLWGPPGCGKTTLAGIIGRSSGAAVQSISAVTEGVSDLKQIIVQARRRGGRTLLIVDEIHRWSRAQQAALLPHVEEGLVTLIGVTSENPYFDIIAPLRSRLRIVRLEPLTADGLRQILIRALADRERGLGELGLEIDDEALDALVDTAGGDARTALNALEAAAMATAADPAGGPAITAARVWAAIQQRQIRYDRKADDHYQTISAYIKSVRGSDPDAAIFWLAKMVIAGEDVRFITRRMLILASEDIGNADPVALVVANAAAQAVEQVGYPEAELILAQATLYLANAPKSNTALKALAAAKDAIERGANTEVPLHLRNASFGGAERLGYGRDYRYPHDFPRHWVQQQYLPDGVAGGYFHPSGEGREVSRPRAPEPED